MIGNAREYYEQLIDQSLSDEDMIDKAFEYAHLADPNAALFYNDYNESF